MNLQLINRCKNFSDGINSARSNIISPERIESLLSLRGQQPAQETRCFEVGKTDISTPISEMTEIAVIGSEFKPVTVCSNSRAYAYGSA